MGFDVGSCQNYGPFLGTLNIRAIRCRNYYIKDAKRDHNFDNHPCEARGLELKVFRV